jgi:hypothetical protein
MANTLKAELLCARAIIKALTAENEELEQKNAILKAKLESNNYGYEDDGQPSEMQEWQDFDRDC